MLPLSNPAANEYTVRGKIRHCGRGLAIEAQRNEVAEASYPWLKKRIYIHLHSRNRDLSRPSLVSSRTNIPNQVGSQRVTKLGQPGLKQNEMPKSDGS